MGVGADGAHAGSVASGGGRERKGEGGESGERHPQESVNTRPEPDAAAREPSTDISELFDQAVGG
jgi:hypothetical protein